MNSIKRTAAVAAIACVAALGASPAPADVISNPTNTDSFLYLSGALQGGQQTQFVGQTFAASITGALTDFQFTLNSSTITRTKRRRSFRLLTHRGKRYAGPDLCGLSEHLRHSK